MTCFNLSPTQQNDPKSSKTPDYSSTTPDYNLGSNTPDFGSNTHSPASIDFISSPQSLEAYIRIESPAVGVDQLTKQQQQEQHQEQQLRKQERKEPDFELIEELFKTLVSKHKMDPS